jgi:hypothetical protein
MGKYTARRSDARYIQDGREKRGNARMRERKKELEGVKMRMIISGSICLVKKGLSLRWKN